MRLEQVIESPELDIRTKLLRFVGDTANRQAFIASEGRALQERYAQIEQAFRDILQITGGYPYNSDFVGNPIILGRGAKKSDHISYMGTYKASVASVENREMPQPFDASYPRPTFRVTISFEPDNVGKMRINKPITESFGASWAFSQVRDEGWNQGTLEYAATAYEGPVAEAEHTVAMLRRALSDAELNPVFAEQMAALQQA